MLTLHNGHHNISYCVSLGHCPEDHLSKKVLQKSYEGETTVIVW